MSMSRLISQLRGDDLVPANSVSAPVHPSAPQQFQHVAGSVGAGRPYPLPQPTQMGGQYNRLPPPSGFSSSSTYPEPAQDAYAYSLNQQQQHFQPIARSPPQPARIGQANNTLSNSSMRENELEFLNKELLEEIERKNKKISQLEEKLIESEVGALQSVRRSLKFEEKEKLTKPLICILLQCGNILYFDNVKPFELFTIQDEVRVNTDLQLLEGEYDCSFRGTIEDHAYFSTIRGKIIKFFKAGLQNGQVHLELVNEMKTTEISLFHNEPLYFIERSRDWSLYQYHESYTQTEGEKFDISEIDLLSKYERHYHRGVLYLFRESSKAMVKRVNEKVVRVEGPLLDRDVTSFYNNPNSDCIYIINSDEKVLIIINTTLLSVTQFCYEAPADSNNHSIVGIHDRVLTMAFDGVWGRHLSSTRLA